MSNIIGKEITERIRMKENKYSILRKEMWDKIESFRNFKKGWDSYNGEPIPDKVIDEAKRLVPFLVTVYDFVAPDSDGGIVFENKGNDIGLSISVG